MKIPYRRFADHITESWKLARNFWAFSLICSLVLAFLCAVIFFCNPYGYFVPSKVTIGLVSVPFIFIGFSYLLGTFLQSKAGSISKGDWLWLAIWSGSVACVLFFVFPAPRPLISQNHRLELIASGDKNDQSPGFVVEIRQVLTMDGKKITPEQFSVAGDWQSIDGELLSSRGSPNSTAILKGPFPGGVIIRLRYVEDGGKIKIRWDGVEKEIDLFSSPSTNEDFVFDGFSWEQLTSLQSALILVTYAVYFLGLTIVVLLFNLLIRVGLFQSKIMGIVLIFVFISITAAFIFEKLSYYDFSGVRPFRDSRSYVQNADLPINSLAFWAGERPFTLPLLLKLLDVHYADGWSTQVMVRIRSFQVWISIICWTMLALMVSIRIRQTWLKPAAFACILAFSLGLEIGLWDHLMLSESLSISSFAALVAGWLGWQQLFDRKTRGWVHGLYLTGLIILSVLYSFVRDSNLYFLLMAGIAFLFGVIFKKTEKFQKSMTGMYILAILLIAIFQNLSISVGNRWQVFIYDHLADRILVNAQAREFFVAHGLPISNTLMGIVDLYGYQYQDMIRNDPQLQPVKLWVDQYGKSTYLLYLMSDFDNAFIEPIRQVSALLDGSSMPYQYPIYPSHPYSNQILVISQAFYFRSPISEWLAGIVLLGASIIWIVKLRVNSIWLVLAILALSIYPMMFIVWHGDPLEIERHAIQIGIQFRLAAWIALIFIVDAFTIRVLPVKPIIATLDVEKAL